MMQFIIEESEHARTMRRIVSCTHTLYWVLEELEDPDEVELRGDLLIAAERLLEAVIYVTDSARNIAWQYTPEPEHEEDLED
jgi:hypothetical protein